MNDLISRQAAIEALRNQMSDWNDDYNVPVRKSIENLERLPSAPPEIIRCKDCKFTDGDGPIADGRYWCVLHGSFMYFCSDAERRTDE